FFTALLYISDTSKWPMQLVLRTYVVNDTAVGQADRATEFLPPQASLQSAILVVSMVPVRPIYAILPQHLAKGVLTGAVKGCPTISINAGKDIPCIPDCCPTVPSSP